MEPGARVVTDGWSGQSGLPENPRGARVVGDRKAHEVLKWIHRVFSNLRRWAMGVLHGLRRKHFQRYLDELVFRWNRRRHRRSSFGTLLGIGLRLKPATSYASSTGVPEARRSPPGSSFSAERARIPGFRPESAALTAASPLAAGIPCPIRRFSRPATATTSCGA